MGHILVTGATGGIGTALAGALVAAGHRVTAVGPRPTPGTGGAHWR